MTESPTFPPTAPPPQISPPASVHAAWDEAFLRVESYLRAHHLKSRVLLNQISSDIIAEARGRALECPVAEPVTLAMEVVHGRAGAWFVRIFAEGDWSDERFRTRGRLAQLLADMPARWPNSFLSDEFPPAELVQAMAGSYLQPGPELRFSNMPPASLELPPEEDSLQWQPYNRWRFVRSAASWMVILCLFGVAWAASH
jgi:hypothetical protein